METILLHFKSSGNPLLIWKSDLRSAMWREQFQETSIELTYSTTFKYTVIETPEEIQKLIEEDSISS